LLLVVQLVGTHRLQVNDLPLGQVGGLVEHEAPVVDLGFEALHRIQV